MQDDDLDRLLARAAAAPPPPASDLLDRVLADALAELKRSALPVRPQAWATGRPRAARTPRAAGRLGWLAAVFGGAPMLAGVCTAAFAGMAIGYLEPGTLDLLTGGNADVTELFPQIDFLPTEG